MNDGKLARVTAFSKEQGFGRVVVADEGELAFDMSVAQCPVDGLTVGADVFVCTGPARVPGQRKVTRLWRGDGPPPPPPEPQTNAVERFESFGPYNFLLPPFWPADSVNRGRAVSSSGAMLNDVKCMLLVCVGGASDAKVKSDLIATRSAVARTTRCDQQVLGLPFEGYRFDRGAEVELLYVLAAHGDLLTVGCIFAAGNEQAAAGLSPLLLTMVGAAVHRRGPPAPSPAPKGNEGGFWKRLFG